MTKLELLNLLTKLVIEYRKDCVDSIKRNSHMNNYKEKRKTKQSTVDAILVDFVNFVGVHQEIDYGLHTKHLIESKTVPLNEEVDLTVLNK